MKHLLFVLIALVGMSSCSTESLDVDLPSREHSEVCFDTMGSLLTSSAPQRASIFIGMGHDVPVAAVDLLFCARSGCEDCFIEGSRELCLGCLEALCPTPMAACRGVEWSEYETSIDEPLRTCWELRSCSLRCNADEERCEWACYWSARPGARLAYWRLGTTAEGRCASDCTGRTPTACELCLRRYEIERALAQCFEPAPIER